MCAHRYRRLALALTAFFVAGLGVAAAQGPPRSKYAGAARPLEAPMTPSSREPQSQDLTGHAREWILGTWRSNTDGNFVLTFMADGTYSYSHRNRRLQQIAEHTGTWLVALSPRISESTPDAIRIGSGAWPAVDGIVGRRAEGAGLIVSLRPQRIAVYSSAPPVYLGNDPASFRIAFRIEPGAQRPERMRMLHLDQGPADQFGQMRFTRER